MIDDAMSIIPEHANNQRFLCYTYKENKTNQPRKTHILIAHNRAHSLPYFRYTYTRNTIDKH